MRALAVAAALLVACSSSTETAPAAALAPSVAVAVPTATATPAATATATPAPEPDIAQCLTDDGRSLDIEREWLAGLIRYMHETYAQDDIPVPNIEMEVEAVNIRETPAGGAYVYTGQYVLVFTAWTGRVSRQDVHISGLIRPWDCLAVVGGP